MSRISTEYQFKDHPQTCDRDDLWGQVKRTVGGKPVTDEQIAMIIDAISQGVDLNAQDRLLDLCCGNGALSTQLFERCAGGLGVDYSDFLIEVANERFARPPVERYVLDDALAYLHREEEPQLFTKAMCYGAFPYFPQPLALEFLQLLHARFTGIEQIFLGQLPDRSRMDEFFTSRVRVPGEEDDPGSLMGIWRTQEQLTELAHRAGWDVRCSRMPTTFFSSHYRFDAILTRI